MGTPNGNIVVYYFRDTAVHDFQDPSLSDPTSFDWGWLPGRFQPSLFGLPVDPNYVADQGENTGGSKSDWGGYVPGLDLTPYAAANYDVFISLESEWDNDGPEEAYILGGVTASQVIPEPLTLLAVFSGVAGVAGYVRRRRRLA
jgi:hypothetical protein